MVLRDEDLRGLNYSDIFMDPATKVKRETLPDFNDPDWHSTKLIHSWPNVKDRVSYESQGDATRSCFQRQRVSCRHITHSDRHSGSSEAKAKMLRIRQEDIRNAGRWIQHSSKMDVYYDDEPAYFFAVQMAGFLGGQVPFHLKRNEVSPSLDLQRQIFPFIEAAFGPPGSPEYDEWQVEWLRRTAAERLDQAMMYWDTVFDYGMNVFKETASRIESNADSSMPPRWTTVAQHQPLPQPRPPHPQAMPVHQQSSVTTTTTATATMTTTTATTTTNVTTGGVTVNYRLGSVAAIWEGYQEFEQERQKSGKKSLGISRKHQKQLNNKRRVIEEVEYRAGQIRANDLSMGQEDSIQRSMLELDTLFKKRSWTVNQLINYCRDQKAERERTEAAE
ncbi:hypothetical protein KI688_001743 [Linnemannia hyalina]|uniref:Uncharacterized protein n=1 Tax=Linnemannia hyalina TaxID=64524 RepID=A0A9P7XSI9_9FUNG|nr:hypothetical protein KI688_001743 [Linnemannia hyalina]